MSGDNEQKPKLLSSVRVGGVDGGVLNRYSHASKSTKGKYLVSYKTNM